jgi:hypothetical protein
MRSHALRGPRKVLRLARPDIFSHHQQKSHITKAPGSAGGYLLVAIWTYCSACHGCEFLSRASTCKTVRFLVSPCGCCSVAGHSVFRGSNSSGDRCILVSLGDLAPELDRAGRHHRWRAHRWHRCDLVWLSSWHCSVRPQTRVRKRSPVDSKPVFTWRAARIFLPGDPISSVVAVWERSRFLMNWVLTIKRFVHRRRSTTLSRCASSLPTLKVYPNE